MRFSLPVSVFSYLGLKHPGTSYKSTSGFWGYAMQPGLLEKKLATKTPFCLCKWANPAIWLVESDFNEMHLDSDWSGPDLNDPYYYGVHWKRAFANRLSCQWQDWKYRKLAHIEFYSAETKIGYVASQIIFYFCNIIERFEDNRSAEFHDWPGTRSSQTMARLKGESF